jgi:DNA-binding CsgD family transcriptional regulator
MTRSSDGTETAAPVVPVTDAAAVALALSALDLTQCERHVLTHSCLVPVNMPGGRAADDDWTSVEITDAANALAERRLLTVDSQGFAPASTLADAVVECVQSARRTSRSAMSSDRESLHSAIVDRLGPRTHTIGVGGQADDEFAAIVDGAGILVNAIPDAPADACDEYYDEKRNELSLALSRAERVRTEVDVVSPDRLRRPAEATYFGDLGHERHCTVRTSAVSLRLALIDDCVAILPIDPHDHVRGAIVTADEEAVAFVGLQLAVQLAASEPYVLDLAPVLTPRELRVLRLLAEGHTDESGGRRLGVSDRSVRRIVVGLQRKLGVDSRFELAVAAARHGLL